MRKLGRKLRLVSAGLVIPRPFMTHMALLVHACLARRRARNGLAFDGWDTFLWRGVCCCVLCEQAAGGSPKQRRSESF